MSDDPFQQLEAALQSGGVDAALEALIEQLREQRRYHELFEALKMRVRRKIGLPLLYHDLGDDLDESGRDQLEDGLIEACREVGSMLLADGFIRDGYIYMRPVGDRAAVAEMLAAIEVTDDNLDDVVEVALHEGVDTRLGLSLVLEHYGTCNSITMFETVIAQRPLEDRRLAAGMLVEHLHQELTQAVMNDIARQEGAQPPAASLAELVADRDWLFESGSYHVDTTHLASVTRFARELSDPALLRLALDLTEYGRRLSSQFQYGGDPPFDDVYPAHALYFRALLGEQVEEALQYFRQQAEQADVPQTGTAPVEVYIGLLARLGRPKEAIAASLELLPAKVQLQGIAPPLIELSQQAGDYEAMLEHCREKNDLLGFAAGLFQSHVRH